MLESIVNSTAWKVIGALLTIGCLMVSAYCWHDADQEAKGLGRYASEDAQ